MHQRTIEMIEDIQQREKQFYVVEIQMRQKQILEEMDFNNDPNRDLKLPSFNLDTGKGCDHISFQSLSG